MALAVASLGLGCGFLEKEEEPPPPPPKPPKFSEPKIECVNSEDDDLDEKVISKVSVRVTDEKRDLLTRNGALCGTLDGLPIALRDDDADQIFSWSPSKEASDGPCNGGIAFPKNRMICKGDFELKVSAEDKEGNRTELDEVITKGSSS